MVMELLGVGGSIVGGLLGQSQAEKEAEERRAREEAAIRAERKSARYSYSATEDSVNLMKAIDRENAINAVAEVDRSYASDQRGIKEQTKKAAGSVANSGSDGLASGNSRGRQMVSMYSKANKAMNKSKSEQKSMVSKISDDYDKRQNDLNNKLISSYQNMSAVLADEGVSSVGSTAGAWTGGAISGMNTGLSLGNSYTDMFGDIKLWG